MNFRGELLERKLKYMSDELSLVSKQLILLQDFITSQFGSKFEDFCDPLRSRRDVGLGVGGTFSSDFSAHQTNIHFGGVGLGGGNEPEDDSYVSHVSETVTGTVTETNPSATSEQIQGGFTKTNSTHRRPVFIPTTAIVSSECQEISQSESTTNSSETMKQLPGASEMPTLIPEVINCSQVEFSQESNDESESGIDPNDGKEMVDSNIEISDVKCFEAHNDDIEDMEEESNEIFMLSDDTESDDGSEYLYPVKTRSKSNGIRNAVIMPKSTINKSNSPKAQKKRTYRKKSDKFDQPWKSNYRNLPNGRIQCTFKDCNRDYTNIQKFQRHFLLHMGVMTFICDMCPAAYTRKDELDSHKQAHVFKFRFNTGKITATTKKFHCSVCSKTFLSIHDYRDHDCQ